MQAWWGAGATLCRSCSPSTPQTPKQRPCSLTETLFPTALLAQSGSAPRNLCHAEARCTRWNPIHSRRIGPM